MRSGWSWPVNAQTGHWATSGWSSALNVQFADDPPGGDVNATPSAAGNRSATGPHSCNAVLQAESVSAFAAPPRIADSVTCSYLYMRWRSTPYEMANILARACAFKSIEEMSAAQSSDALRWPSLAYDSAMCR